MSASCPSVGKGYFSWHNRTCVLDINLISPSLQLTGFLRTEMHSTEFECAPDSGPTRAPDSRIQRNRTEAIRNSPLFWRTSRRAARSIPNCCPPSGTDSLTRLKPTLVRRVSHKFWDAPRQVARLPIEQACYMMRLTTEQKATTMTGPQRRTLGYVRGSTHEQAISGLSLKARKRKVILYAPATAPPLASRASNRSLARLACVDPEIRKTGHEKEDRTD